MATTIHAVLDKVVRAFAIVDLSIPGGSGELEMVTVCESGHGNMITHTIVKSS